MVVLAPETSLKDGVPSNQLHGQQSAPAPTAIEARLKSNMQIA